MHNERLDIKHNGPVAFFTPKKQNIETILRHLESADLIIMNDLDWFKSILVNRIEKHKKILWRFFGYELYNRKMELFVSMRTKELVRDRALFGRRHGIIKIKAELKDIIFQGNKSFFRAIKRIDGILLFSKEEHEFLKQHWEVPPFIRLPLLGKTLPKEDNDKDAIILIGNSRSIYNNHFDILRSVRNCRDQHGYQFMLLFNYGAINSYSLKVKEYALGITNVSLIEDLMGLEEFEGFYEKIAALVINGYRQMALGNIFIALKTGVKIYLNRLNPIYTWLKDSGFHISQVDGLESDLINNAIKLSLSEANFNINQFNSLIEEYTLNSFYAQLIKLYNSNN